MPLFSFVNSLVIKALRDFPHIGCLKNACMSTFYE
nr:MAG TPA: hypothetical protein [Caudoviricetes sp.]